MSSNRSRLTGDPVDRHPDGSSLHGVAARTALRARRNYCIAA